MMHKAVVSSAWEQTGLAVSLDLFILTYWLPFDNFLEGLEAKHLQPLGQVLFLPRQHDSLDFGGCGLNWCIHLGYAFHSLSLILPVEFGGLLWSYNKQQDDNQFCGDRFWVECITSKSASPVSPTYWNILLEVGFNMILWLTENPGRSCIQLINPLLAF